jgi:hypothetical protein
MAICCCGPCLEIYRSDHTELTFLWRRAALDRLHRAPGRPSVILTSPLLDRILRCPRKIIRSEDVPGGLRKYISWHAETLRASLMW